MTITEIAYLLNISPDGVRLRAKKLGIFSAYKDYDNDEVNLIRYYEKKPRKTAPNALPPYTYNIVKAFDVLRPNNTSVNIAEYTGINVVLVNRVLDKWFSGKNLLIKSRL